MESRASSNTSNRPRKTIKHFDLPGHIHELTFSTYQRIPVLRDNGIGEILATAIDRALDRHKYLLHAYVFMPEHVHLAVRPIENASPIASLLYAIKSPSSARIRRLFEERNDSRLQRMQGMKRGKPTFRFWQIGPGYDRNLTNDKAVRTSIKYIHRNPVSRGLVEQPGDWRWSSWAEYVDYQLVGQRSPRVTLLGTQ